MHHHTMVPTKNKYILKTKSALTRRSIDDWDRRYVWYGSAPWQDTSSLNDFGAGGLSPWEGTSDLAVTWLKHIAAYVH